MSNAILPLAVPVNEPVRSYAPGRPEKQSLKKRLNEMLNEQIEIPLIIGGKEVRTGDIGKAVCPHDHRPRARHLPPGRRRPRWRRPPRRRRRPGASGARRAGKSAPSVLPARRRPARRPLARHRQRRHHAQPVEDRLPGRDRLGLRADRLLALQPLLHAGALRRAAVVPTRRCGTGWSTGRSKGSSSPSRRSTSPPSAATCRPRRR